MPYLLDTNIVSDLVHHPRGHARAQVDRVGENEVFTSIIVAAELRYGAIRRNSATLSERLEAVLARLETLALEPPADLVYGELRARLELKGTPIGTNDMLIAAHALAVGFRLVTDNVREFSRVEGLSIENWLR